MALELKFVVVVVETVLASELAAVIDVEGQVVVVGSGSEKSCCGLDLNQAEGAETAAVGKMDVDFVDVVVKAFVGTFVDYDFVVVVKEFVGTVVDYDFVVAANFAAEIVVVEAVPFVAVAGVVFGVAAVE